MELNVVGGRGAVAGAAGEEAGWCLRGSEEGGEPGWSAEAEEDDGGHDEGDADEGHGGRRGWEVSVFGGGCASGELVHGRGVCA